MRTYLPHDEPRILVTGVVKGIQATRNERVIERAHGKQTLSEMMVAEAERAEKYE